MGRLRRLAYSILVALLVFGLLSLPILSQLYGPVVYLPAYAIASILAGAATWSLFRRFSEEAERTADVDPSEMTEDEETSSVDVDAEIEQLKGER